LDTIPIGTILVSYVAMLFSLSVHEASHAGMAYLLEDDTAARMGRLTLNPLAHIDWLGTVLMPLMGMIFNLRLLGWAKPVPVNPSRLTRRFPMRVGYAMVAGAGPASNLVLSFIFLLTLALYIRFGFPVDPGTRIRLFQAAMGVPVEAFLRSDQFSLGQVMALTLLGRLVIINIALAIFNLLPVGPLDGAGILRGFLPYRALATFDRIQPMISIALLAMFLLGVIGFILEPFFWVGLNLYVEPLARLILGA
jgi:Zn-dependent protease